MIGLSWRSGFGDPDVAKVDTGMAPSRYRERVTPGGPPTSKREVFAAAYLRAAQAYMLISMPTGTSTIFGVFQAILALLAKRGRTSPSLNKLLRNEKFASEIFYHGRVSFYVAAQKSSRLCGTGAPKRRRINKFIAARVGPAYRHRFGEVR
jgi:hypothetical protein